MYGTVRSPSLSSPDKKGVALINRHLDKIQEWGLPRNQLVTFVPRITKFTRFHHCFSRVQAA
ncbi:hypothetical protein M378DRAFT_296621 [Amanita muscaria Koide BX008]|uniref:Uncharacterized protein n=1 Tax=Amanita muscaria (strain Koide BX008) TaxID=946122 RepID=A0A0C2XEF1_AMAMK|nr:hypothetical protein M378DRAFT_296621 [Amanita muscaria Koide BX008]